MSLTTGQGRQITTEGTMANRADDQGGAPIKATPDEIDCWLYMIDVAARSTDSTLVPALIAELRDVLRGAPDTPPWDEDRLRADARKVLATAMLAGASRKVVELFPT